MEEIDEDRALCEEQDRFFFDFVLGTLGRPEIDSPRLHIWDRCNAMVISWLVNGLSAEIKRSVIYNDTAQGIWKELESCFGQTGGTQLYSVQKEISTLEQGTNSFPIFFNAMKSLWDELSSIHKFPTCNCGAMNALVKYEEEQRVIQLLMGLNESYTSVRGTILLMKPLPSVSEVYSIITEEEKQREIKPGSSSFGTESASLHVKTSNNKTSSAPQGASGKQGSDRKPLFCSNCKKTNHTIDRCFFLIGFPPGYVKNKEKSASSEEKFAGILKDMNHKS